MCDSQIVAVTHLILVNVLVVDLKRVGGQLLCFIQFPKWEWKNERGSSLRRVPRQMRI